MKVLITGGCGFIGSHIAEHCCAQGAEVTVLDSLRSGFRHNLDGLAVNLVEASVTERDVVMRACEGVDYIFHLAAMISVPESLEKPHECVDINVTGTLNVLEAARQQGAKKVVLSSSAAIYGDDPSLPKTEDMRPAPKTPYGITKLDGEYYLEMYRQEYGLGTASLRYFNVFGPRQDPKSQYAAAVPIFIHRAVRNQDITIYGDGGQTRDFVYVKDVVAANWLAATNPIVHGVFNVARGEKMTIQELAETIIETVGSSSRIINGPERPGDIRHSLASTGRLKTFGFAPATDLKAGLTATIDFFRAEA